MLFMIFLSNAVSSSHILLMCLVAFLTIFSQLSELAAWNLETRPSKKLM